MAVIFLGVSVKNASDKNYLYTLRVFLLYMYIINSGNIRFFMLAIRLSAEVEMRLQRLASKTGRTKTYYARKAILDSLEDMEDTFLALERLEYPAKSWTQEELEREVDLAH